MATLYERLCGSELSAQEIRQTVREYEGNPYIAAALRGVPLTESLQPVDQMARSLRRRCLGTGQAVYERELVFVQELVSDFPQPYWSTMSLAWAMGLSVGGAAGLHIPMPSEAQSWQLGIVTGSLATIAIVGLIGKGFEVPSYQAYAIDQTMTEIVDLKEKLEHLQRGNQFLKEKIERLQRGDRQD